MKLGHRRNYHKGRAIVGVFSVIVQLVVEPMDSFTALPRSLALELPLGISVVSVVTRDQPDLQSREVVIIIEYIFRTLYFDKVWHVFIFLPVSQPVSNAADFQIVLIFIPQMSSRQQLEHTANPHHSWDLSS